MISSDYTHGSEYQIKYFKGQNAHANVLRVALKQGRTRMGSGEVYLIRSVFVFFKFYLRFGLRNI